MKKVLKIFCLKYFKSTVKQILRVDVEKSSPPLSSSPYAFKSTRNVLFALNCFEPNSNRSVPSIPSIGILKLIRYNLQYIGKAKSVKGSHFLSPSHRENAFLCLAFMPFLKASNFLNIIQNSFLKYLICINNTLAKRRKECDERKMNVVLFFLLTRYH